MKTLLNKLTPQDYDSLIGLIIKESIQIKYLEDEVLTSNNILKMEKWELKEYDAVYQDHKNEILCIKEKMIENEIYFNNILSKYNLSTATFLSQFTPSKFKR